CGWTRRPNLGIATSRIGCDAIIFPVLLLSSPSALPRRTRKAITAWRSSTYEDRHRGLRDGRLRFGLCPGDERRRPRDRAGGLDPSTGRSRGQRYLSRRALRPPADGPRRGL